MTHIIFTLCRTDRWVWLSSEVGTLSVCLAGGHQSRSNEAISELKCHKSDGRKTNWTHTLCIFHRSTWGPPGRESKGERKPGRGCGCSGDKGGVLCFSLGVEEMGGCDGKRSLYFFPCQLAIGTLRPMGDTYQD